MKKLEERILQDGQVLSPRVIKVDAFLNHQVDPAFVMEIGQEIARRFEGEGITKIVTIEASGIHVAFAAALALGVPFVYAKKKKAVTQSGDLYVASAYSFTRQEECPITLSKQFLDASDKVLVVDDILAEGAGVKALMDILNEAHVELAGVSVVVEKSFQKGRAALDELGIPVYALARIARMSPEEGIEFLAEVNEKEATSC